MKVNCAVLVFYCAFLSRVKPQNPSSPCTDVLKYEDLNPTSGSWSAILSLGTSDDLNGVWVLVGLDRDVEELASQSGETTEINSREYLIAHEDFLLKRQNTFLIKISAKYDASKAIPSVVVIKLNGRLVCENPPTTTPATTTTLEQQDSCGTISKDGRWPWLVAIMLLGNDETLKFRCGGVLISDLHVLTTGSCVMIFQTQRLKPEELLLYLGTDSLRKPGRNLQIAQVSKIHLHPKYKFKGYFDWNDLSVLKLARSVVRNSYVTPVCLPGMRLIAQKPATLVSWSRKVNGTILQQEMKMKDARDSCLRYDLNFFSQFTSSESFCAGFTNRTMKCVGISGSGLVSQSPDGLQWRLHGIAMFNPEQCQPDYFAIFMNVTHYVDWLTDIIF